MTQDPLAVAYNRGLALEKAGDLDGAEHAYREVLALDPEDHGGASIRLAAMGRADAPDMAPEAYVATLFDQNAATFDDMLVEQLGYAVPMLMRERFDCLGLGPFARVLDLGCGTGLTGASLAGLRSHLTGVDLSEEMLAEASERECYDDLYVGEAVAFLQEISEAPWDLIAATDVLPYIGDLDPFFAGAAKCLESTGILCVSTETAPGSTLDYHVGAKHRFAHSPAYLEGMMAKHGFHAVELREIVVRYDEGDPVPGFLLIAARDGDA